MRVPAIVLIVALSACTHLPSTDDLASTDHFVVTTSDLARWQPVFEADRAQRRALAKSDDRRRELVRRIALVRLTLLEGQSLVAESRRKMIRQDLVDRAVRRLYTEEILRPEVEVNASTVRRIFDEHRDGYRKARGVKLLEIFLWAPEDLVDLRRERRRLLEELTETIDTREDFERAARQYSDASNSFRGGLIGTVLEDQLAEPQRSAVFDVEPGLSDIVETADGLFLFDILTTTPARTGRFEDLAEGIAARLERDQLGDLLQAAVDGFTNGLELASPAPSDHQAPVARIHGRELSLAELALDRPAPARIRQRVVSAAMAEELRNRGLEPPLPTAEQVDWRLYGAVWPLLVESLGQPAAVEKSEDRKAEQPGAQLQRWSFRLLVVDGCATSSELFTVFRSLHELGPGATLEALGDALASGWQLKARIETFDDVLPSDVAGLGPELHTTLARRLDVGDLSRPLHIADRQQVVVVHLQSRRDDLEATAERHQRRATAEARRRAAALLEQHLLTEHSYRWTGSRDP